MKRLHFIFALFALILFSGCGLETYYTLNPPPRAINAPVYTSVDYTANYFEFESATNNNSDSSFLFLGTAVYYRIYADSSVMLSRRASISSVNTTSDYSAAALRMIGYGYQQLNTSDGSVQPLITAEGATVRIRLTNYGDANDANNDYRATISVINKIPRRTLGNNKTFDFGRRDKSAYGPSENYALPVSGDEDFESGTVTDNKYYVDMYAVAIGRDTTYTTYYSNVLHLGSVPIDASLENN